MPSATAPGSATRERRSFGIALPLVLVLLTFDNFLTNRVLPGWLYVPTRATTAVAIVWVAVAAAGSTRAELGLDRARLAAGLRWGGAVAAIECAVLVVAAAVPQTRTLFEDRRVMDHLGTAGLIDQALWQIPFGTVLFEEIAFRGVLLALLRQRWPTAGAVAGSCALFGLWHVLPGSGIATFNPAFSSAGEAVAKVAGVLAVVGAAAVGYALCQLRLRSGHLAAPVLAHAGFNVVAFVLAWVVLSSR